MLELECTTVTRVGSGGSESGIGLIPGLHGVPMYAMRGEYKEEINGCGSNGSNEDLRERGERKQIRLSAEVEIGFPRERNVCQPKCNA